MERRRGRSGHELAVCRLHRQRAGYWADAGPGNRGPLFRISWPAKWSGRSALMLADLFIRPPCKLAAGVPRCSSRVSPFFLIGGHRMVLSRALDTFRRFDRQRGSRRYRPDLRGSRGAGFSSQSSRGPPGRRACCSTLVMGLISRTLPPVEHPDGRFRHEHDGRLRHAGPCDRSGRFSGKLICQSLKDHRPVKWT